MKTFLTRTISAAVALALLIIIYYYLQINGIKLVCYFAVFVGGFELTKILLPPETGHFHKFLFYLIALLVFHIASNYASFALVALALLIIIFLAVSLVTQEGFKELGGLVRYQALSILGFIYIGLLPSYAYRLLDLEHGLVWFATLLAVVFCGDVGAYLTGVLFGKHKISPRLSPKKSWEGSFGGLLGSLIAGYVCSQYLPQIQTKTILVTALCAGFIAQFGDFFESLMKRVVNAKDSGKLMPGHGGILDRIDGLLFASPIILLVASLSESLI
ncbi:MAG: phosphatidate cytidylyltransferase [Pseudobdellovibrionaceae bacterium]